MPRAEIRAPYNARQCTHIIRDDPCPNTDKRWGESKLSPYYRCRIETQRFSDLPKVIQKVCGRAGV